ncbi:MAG: zinc ribbon domain-containing protein [Candidatus Thorarchaeota archaeon]
MVLRLREFWLVIIGFIMLGLGVALLARSGTGFSFFVFPFFFIGDSGLFIPLVIVSSLMVMILFFWWVNSQFPEDARFLKYQEPQEGVLKIVSQCQFCGSPLPENASFCSSCGSQVEQGLDDTF